MPEMRAATNCGHALLEPTLCFAEAADERSIGRKKQSPGRGAFIDELALTAASEEAPWRFDVAPNLTGRPHQFDSDALVEAERVFPGVSGASYESLGGGAVPWVEILLPDRGSEEAADSGRSTLEQDAIALLV